MGHESGCDCVSCRRLKARVMTVEDWLAKHRSHGDLTHEPFPEHPSGSWYWLVCACGAKHLIAKEDQEARRRPMSYGAVTDVS